MTGLFMKTIVLSAINGKSNPTKNQYRPKDLSSFDEKAWHVLKVKLFIIENSLIILMHEYSILQIWLSNMKDCYLQMTTKAFI